MLIPIRAAVTTMSGAPRLAGAILPWAPSVGSSPDAHMSFILVLLQGLMPGARGAPEQVKPAATIVVACTTLTVDSAPSHNGDGRWLTDIRAGDDDAQPAW
jgi:hypothetical protein